jgi:chemotaxis signal transduction protein
VSSPELCVVFWAGADRFALPAAQVFKVIEPAAVNRLPRLPEALRGIAQHRGRIVTVVDLAQLLEAEEASADSEASRVIILDRRGRHLGIWVDAVEAIQAVRRPEAPGELSVLTHHQGQAVTVLDPDRLIDRVEALIEDV